MAIRSESQIPLGNLADKYVAAKLSSIKLIERRTGQILKAFRDESIHDGKASIHASSELVHVTGLVTELGQPGC